MARTKLIGEQREGSVGDVTYYQRNGQTIVRVKRGRTSKTLRAMKHKVKWSNVLNSWKQLSAHNLLKDNFQRGPGQTEYNIYMSLNIRVGQMCLTKDMAKEGYVVLDNFVVSYGPLLPVVEVRQEADLYVSNISVGPLEVNDDTPLSELIVALANHNEGFLRNENDELLFYRIAQGKLYTLKGTRISLKYNQIYDSRTLSQAFGPGLFRSSGGFLATPVNFEVMVTWVRRTREADGRIIATTQRLVGEPESAYLYATEGALERAIESYSK